MINNAFKELNNYNLIMSIIIDSREVDIIKEFNKHNISHETNQLDIGDCHLLKNNELMMIIERKHVNDLASSILDGRYKEQAYRLQKSSLHNHQIVYLIEGSINNYHNKFSRITKETLLSALFSLNFYLGFSLVFSENVNMSILLIHTWSKKLLKENKVPYYQNKTIEDTSYLECVTIKKKHLNKEHLDIMMLMQIPGLSSHVATQLLQEHKTCFKLLKHIHTNKDFLKDFTYKTKTGKDRHLSKKVIEQINNIVDDS